MPIKNRISKFENEITQWRHYFHENPELAYKEKNTAKKVGTIKSLMLIKLKLVLVKLE